MAVLTGRTPARGRGLAPTLPLVPKVLHSSLPGTGVSCLREAGILPEVRRKG